MVQDGTKIAFVTNLEERRNGNGAIYVMNSDDGSRQKRLTSNINPETETGPSWSPDGRKIALNSCDDRTPTCKIYVMNADGSGRRNISNNPAMDPHPE